MAGGGRAEGGGVPQGGREVRRLRVVGAGLEQQHPPAGVDQPGRQRAARRAGADHDDVPPVGRHRLSVSATASSRRCSTRPSARSLARVARVDCAAAGHTSRGHGGVDRRHELVDGRAGRRPSAVEQLLLPVGAVGQVELQDGARVLGQLGPVPAVERAGPEVVHPAQRLQVGDDVALGMGHHRRAPAQHVVADEHGARLQPEGQVVRRCARAWRRRRWSSRPARSRSPGSSTRPRGPGDRGVGRRRPGRRIGPPTAAPPRRGRRGGG